MFNTSNPLGERLLARGGGLNDLISNLVSIREACKSDVKEALVSNLVSARESCKSDIKKSCAYNSQLVVGSSYPSLDGEGGRRPDGVIVGLKAGFRSIRKQGEGEYQYNNEKCKTFTVIASVAKQSSHHHYAESHNLVIDTSALATSYQLQDDSYNELFTPSTKVIHPIPPFPIQGRSEASWKGGCKK